MTTIARRMVRRAKVNRPLIAAILLSNATYAAFVVMCYSIVPHWTLGHTVYFGAGLIGHQIILSLMIRATVETLRRRAIDAVLNGRHSYAASDD